MNQSVITLKNLICGYTINIFDSPKVVSGNNSQNYMALRLTHSPIRFMFSLNGYHVAFENWLTAINIKPSDARAKAIENAIVEWAMQHADIVFGKYNQNVSEQCDGKCESRMCLAKPPPE